MYYSANSSGQDIPSLPSLLLTRVTAKICYDWRSRATIASKVDPRQPLRGSKIQFPLFAAYFASCRFATIGNWPLRYSSCIYVGHFHDMICFSVLCWADRNKNRKLNVFFLLKLISCHMSLWIKTEDVIINVCDMINGKLHKLIHTNCDFFLFFSTFASKYLSKFNLNQLEAYDELINKPSNDWDIYYWATGTILFLFLHHSCLSYR